MIITRKHKNEKRTFNKHSLARWLYLLAVCALVAWSFLLAVRTAKGEMEEMEIAPVAIKRVEKPSISTPQGKIAHIAVQGQLTASQKANEDQIRAIAKEMGYEAPNFLVALARCESGLNNFAKGDGHYNSRGLFQISKHYHPTVTDDQAYSVDWSTRWTIRKLMNGGSGIWTCTRILNGN